MIIDLKEQTYEIQKQFKRTCDVCGKETEDIVVCSSSFGPFSIAVCKDCLAQGKECYSNMVSYIACAGHFPDEINSEYQALVRNQLILYNKTEEEFIADVEKEIKNLAETLFY